jgi:hypothetical protein
MTLNWENPYEAACGEWRKGNLHTHTDRSKCGKLPISEVIRNFEERGCEFLSITDHNQLTDLSAICSRSLRLLPGIEIDIEGKNHFGVVHSDPGAICYDASATQQDLIDRNVAAGAIVTLHHPDWQVKEHYGIDALLSLQNYTGIEIYNSVIERLSGSPLSTAKWDRLLADGKKVLGFANQDFHNLGDALDCWNVVQTPDARTETIFDALKQGRFYCHCGVNIRSLARVGDTVRVETENARLIRFVTTGGCVFKKVKDRCAEVAFGTLKESDYIRVECLGVGEEISFSQPFFRSAGQGD